MNAPPDAPPPAPAKPPEAAPPPAPAKAPTGAERRTAERRSLRTSAVVLLPGDRQFEVRMLDIAPGGVGIVAEANPRPGTTFQIRFRLPLKPAGSLMVAAVARVVHSVFSSEEGGFKVGLMFVQLPPDAAQAIIRYMK